MPKLTFDNKTFKKYMNNLVDYSVGFLDGMERGKGKFLYSLGTNVSEAASQFIDANARVSPKTLHHVYEWYQTGSPEARLFDISFSVNSTGLNFLSSFRQSKTVKDGSREPFREKATIMENGIGVVITPKNVQALRFTDKGELVFTKKEVYVDNPGGSTQDEFQKTFELFFSRYFTQAFLQNSDLKYYFENPLPYKRNLKAGIMYGRSAGVRTGYNWVVRAEAV
jgi:hypothetical protein